MKKLIILFSLVLLVACSNVEKNIDFTKTTHSLEPTKLDLKNYSGELVDVTITSHIPEDLQLYFQSNIYAYVDGKEYPLFRRRSSRITPSVAIDISTGSSRKNDMDFGLTLSQERHLTEINSSFDYALLKIKGNSKRLIKVRFITSNLYYEKDGEQIDFEKGTIKGSLDVITRKKSVEVASIPISITFDRSETNKEVEDETESEEVENEEDKTAE